jgi:environmental stress-induced protein Ves
MGSDKDQLGHIFSGMRQQQQAAERPGAVEANRLIALASLDAMPWKNGGGTTYQIAADPPQANTSNFRWRVSRAVIERDGPFSAFPDVSRWIVLTSGPGFTLEFTDGTSFEVTKPFEVYWFDGGQAVSCRLKDGRPSTVVNVMARNDVVMRVNIAQNRNMLPSAGHAIVSAYSASVRLDERHVLLAAVDKPF